MSQSDPAAALTAASRPRKVWRRWWFKAAAALIAVLVACYFTATSGAFLRGIVLPRAGAALNAKLSAGEVSLSPFSQLVVRALRLETFGPEPLLQAEEVRVRYNAWAMIGGRMVVPEVSLTAPTVSIVRLPDGKTNLDPLLEGVSKGSKKEKRNKPDKPLEIDLGTVSLRRGMLRFTQQGKDDSRQSSEIGNLEISLPGLRNGQTTKLTLGADLSQANQPPPRATNQADRVQARLAGTFDCTLTPDLMPASLKGDLRVTVSQAQGAFQDVGGLGAALTIDTTLAEIRKLALAFDKAGQNLGRLELSGPFDLNKSEAHLKVAVAGLDRNVLALAGAGRGLDFGQTTLNANSQIDLANQWQTIAAQGRVVLAQLTVRQGALATPSLDVTLDYQVKADLAAKTATVQALSLVGKQRQSDLLTLSLDRPLDVSWGGKAPAAGEATVQLALNRLSLEDWRPFLGTNPPSGRVDVQARLVARQEGRQNTFDIRLGAQDLAATVGTNRIDNARLELEAAGQFNDFKSLALERFSIAARQRDGQLLAASGSASYTLGTNAARGQITLESALPDVLRAFPVPQLAVESGRFKLDGQLAQENGAQTVRTTLLLDRFTGRYGDYQFREFQLSAEVAAQIRDQNLDIRQCSLTLRAGNEAGGSVQVGGAYDLGSKVGQLSFAVSNLNQSVLAPIAAPFLKPNTLSSVNLNLKGAARYDPAGETSGQLTLDVGRLLVADPANKLPATPLDAQFQLEVAQRQSRFDIRQCSLALPPTARARNQVQLSGKLDLAATNAAPTQLALSAESLDLTPLYDFFTTNKSFQTPAPASSGRSASPVGGPANTSEPAPIKLPLEQASVDLQIGRLFLGETSISNWTASVRLKQDTIALNPFRLTLNGTPVNASANADLSKPGYEYEVALQAARLALEPLANTFSPDKRGQFQGDIYADLKLRGAGITGASLQRRLRGRVSFSLTNLNLQVVGPKTKRLLVPIALVLQAPELQDSPLTVVAADAVVGDGQAKLERFLAISPALVATAQGTVQLAEVLTNSPLSLPIQLAVRRNLAERARLLSANTPPDAQYVQLPQFVKVTGTVGDPKTETDKTKLSGQLIDTAGQLVGGKAGNILQGVGGLLKGGNPLAPSTATNAAPQPQPRSATNAPPKATPADLLRGLLGPKR